jgi:hypothetical protein
MVRKHNQPPSGRDEIRTAIERFLWWLREREWSSFYQRQAENAEAEDGAQSAGLRPQSQGKDSTK